MVLIFTWLLRTFVALLTLVSGGLALGYYLASHSLPDYALDRALPKLGAEVRIVRDTHAVPHISSPDDNAILYGLGFAHAQDRLWQMTLSRRAAQGRLSELFGAETVPVDHLMRALDLYGLAARAAERQAPEVTAALQAYADGVNAYLGLVRDEALGRGAPEFFLFEPTIAPWTPADSIAVQKLMALRLTDKAQMEVLRAQLTLRLEPERLADILPDAPSAVMDLPEFAALPDTRHLALAGVPGDEPPMSPVAPAGLAGASNAFAALPARAAAGASLIAADPHLSLTAPGPMYLAHLDFADGGAIGATVPGIPAVVIGRNDRLAWGLTSSYLDDQDIFIERLDPDSADRYETPDGFAAFRTTQSVISVKDEAPRTVTLRWSRHGPVIPEPHFQASTVTPSGHVAALAWTALTPEDRSIEAALRLMRAETLAEARDAAALHVAPSLMLTVADGRNIALYAMGAVPDRDPLHNSQGRIPAAGWAAVNDWRGTLPFETNPAVENPPGGIVVNTNNRITDAAFPRHWSFDWGDSHRIARAERMLNGREFHTLESFTEIQTDTVSPAARILLPLIARNLWYQGEPAAAETVERQRQIALEALAAWNGEMSQHSFEPLIYAAWARELQRRLIVDDLGPLAARLARPDPLFLERVFRDIDGASAWCDIRQSETVETCETVARQALDAAILALSESYGSRIDGWRWGVAHQAFHRHEVLGDIPMLNWLVNIRQETPGGDTTMMRGQTAATGPEPFRNVHGSVYRMVVDFADPDSAAFILSTGQSGHPLSRHYDDQALLWRRSEYIPMSLDAGRAAGGSVGTTILRPEP